MHRTITISNEGVAIRENPAYVVTLRNRAQTVHDYEIPDFRPPLPVPTQETVNEGLS